MPTYKGLRGGASPSVAPRTVPRAGDEIVPGSSPACASKARAKCDDG